MRYGAVKVSDYMADGLQTGADGIRLGLQPGVLAAWYKRIISQTREMAPPWLSDKIHVRQDPVLPMKFDLDISKRAVKYFMIVVSANLDSMPYSTKLYFLRVQESLETEMDKSLV